jgi:hypothetical protein
MSVSATVSSTGAPVSSSITIGASDPQAASANTQELQRSARTITPPT